MIVAIILDIRSHHFATVFSHTYGFPISRILAEDGYLAFLLRSRAIQAPILTTLCEILTTSRSRTTRPHVRNGAAPECPYSGFRVVNRLRAGPPRPAKPFGPSLPALPRAGGLGAGLSSPSRLREGTGVGAYHITGSGKEASSARYQFSHSWKYWFPRSFLPNVRSSCAPDSRPFWISRPIT